jgi:hypothetical protein
MAITLADITRTPMAAAICGLADAGAGPATIQIATSNAFTTLLATFTCSDPAFTAGSAGVQNLDVTPALSVAASNSGTATHWRLSDSAPAVVMTGEVKATADGSDLILSTAAQNAALTAITTLIGATGTLQLTTAGDTGFASPLATINLGNPAFAAASAGSATITGSPTGSASVAGTAALFRIRNTASAEVLRGSVGTSSADMIFNNTTFGIGTAITLTGFNLTLPATSAASIGVMVFSGGVAFTSGETVELSSGSFSMPAS